MRAAKNQVIHVYALGLNLPLAVFYNITAENGLSLAVSGFLIALLIGVLLYILFSEENDFTLKLLKASLAVGSILFWTVILLVYGHVSESESTIYDIADAAMYFGICMIFFSVVACYVITRRAVHKE